MNSHCTTFLVVNFYLCNHSFVIQLISAKERKEDVEKTSAEAAVLSILKLTVKVHRFIAILCFSFMSHSPMLPLDWVARRYAPQLISSSRLPLVLIVVVAFFPPSILMSMLFMSAMFRFSRKSWFIIDLMPFNTHKHATQSQLNWNENVHTFEKATSIRTLVWWWTCVYALFAESHTQERNLNCWCRKSTWKRFHKCSAV